MPPLQKTTAVNGKNGMRCRHYRGRVSGGIRGRGCGKGEDRATEGGIAATTEEGSQAAFEGAAAEEGRSGRRKAA